MDRKSTIIVVVCFLVMGLWSFVLMPRLYPYKPSPPSLTNTLSNTSLAERSQSNPAVASPTLLNAPQAISPVSDFGLRTNVPEDLIEVTNAFARYVFTSYGGGLKEVGLRDMTKNRPSSNIVATLNKSTPLPTLALLDGLGMVDDGIYTIRRTANGVRAEKTLASGLAIVKDFELSSNYLVAATLRLENHSGRALDLPAQQWVVGTATTMGPDDDNSLAVGVLWYNGAKVNDVGASYFSPRGFGCVPRIPPAQYLGGTNNVVWVGAHNQFFALVAMPLQPAQTVLIRKIEMPRPTGEEARLVATNAAAPEGFLAALTYPPATLTPNGTNASLERQIFLYAGPKEYKTLARIADGFGNNLDLVMGFGWSGFVSKALLLGMNSLHHIAGLSYGWAVIAITVLIKVVFWPLTQASTRSMKRMQALQPQVKVIQEKYKEDPVKMQRKMMELWKENKVSPMSGCLPTLIQIPVFFGFYQMIRSAIELRGESWLWVHDLSKPDTLFIIPGLGVVPIFGTPGVGLPFNLLPLIMGASMLWQAHLTPPSPGMDPAQAKIMRYLPLIFMLTLYKFSSGLTLYWTVNNLLSIVQTKLTRAAAETPAPARAPVLTPLNKKKK